MARACSEATGRCMSDVDQNSSCQGDTATITKCLASFCIFCPKFDISLTCTNLVWPYIGYTNELLQHKLCTWRVGCSHTASTNIPIPIPIQAQSATEYFTKHSKVLQSLTCTLVHSTLSRSLRSIVPEYTTTHK